jgi:hypothetical protein
MNPDELATNIDTIVGAADARYTNAIARVQKDLYNQLSVILKDLELDPDGYIKQNSANRKVMSKAEAKIQEVFSSSLYTAAVSNYVSTVPKVDVQNVKYFKSIDTTFSPKRQFLTNLQNETIATVERYVLRDGLQSQVVQPLIQILNQNINSGGQFSGFLQQVRDYVVGNDQVEGRALSYSRTYLRDSLFTYARTYQQSVTNDLGLQWYLYSGGLMDKSREFCVHRSGNYYHHQEVESWASESWQGKKQGTTESSIFLFAGGWNCSHEIITVSSLIVPPSDLERIKKAGEM